MNQSKLKFKKEYSLYRKQLRENRGVLESYMQVACGNAQFKQIRFEILLPVSIKIWAYKRKLIN